jgi:hypothetical protein
MHAYNPQPSNKFTLSVMLIPLIQGIIDGYSISSVAILTALP